MTAHIHRRRKLPLWRWDPFLAGTVLGLSVIAAVFQRLDLPVVSPIALTVLLVGALAAAVCLVLPLFVRRLRRDGEGSLTLTPDIELVAIETDDTLPVVDDRRHRGSIEAALATTDPPFTAVLVPGATAWMGRDLRVAVDILARGRLHRAGYLPREADQRVAAVLAPLAAGGRYVTVPVSIRTTPRGRAITVGIGPAVTGGIGPAVTGGIGPAVIGGIGPAVTGGPGSADTSGPHTAITTESDGA